MTQPFRLAAGGRVDRSTSIAFTFDGRLLQGHAGDTLASALLANGVHLMGRSFKYHRPRGPISAGAEEPNALVSVDRGGGRVTPNLRATQVELYEGLVARSQNRWPSLAFDLGAVSDVAPGGLLSAGFYYKTFMAPRIAWAKVYEPLIRRSAGLGVAPAMDDPDRYAHRYAFCDVLVVGGGAAGLAAALAATQPGGRDILCLEQDEFGGGLLDEARALIDGKPSAEWVGEALRSLSARRHVRMLKRTQAFGHYAQNLVALAERLTDHLAAPDETVPRERLWKVRAKRVILATGAIERPLVFPGNDRPGILLASAATTYVNRYGVRLGNRAVVLCADESGYRAALDLHRVGIEVVTIADPRPNSEGPAAQAAKAAGLRIERGATITATRGRLRVSGVSLGSIGANGAVTGLREEACDLVLMAGGWTPSLHLFSQSRGKVRFDEARQIFVPGEAAQDVVCIGASNGDFGIAAALQAGFAIGGSPQDVAVSGEFVPCGGVHGALPHDRDIQRVKAFVDFQNDVTAKDIALAVREGMRSIEHVKRYTTTGMATDQGKTSNMNGLAITADALGKAIPEVGLTTFRPPYTPVTFGAFAGHARGKHFDPVRKTPMHALAEAEGAVFEDVGLWKRAWYFPKDGEDMHRAVRRECRAVRATCGMFDASTLGKIEVVGPDALEFMNRLYTNSWSKLQPGRLRYAIMLNEAGFVMDDGVVARLAPDRFHVTTTTGGAPRVLAHMEDYLQTEFTDLEVWLTSTTEQWAVIALQGPKAREILAPIVEGIDLEAGAMPHMSVREGRILGVPVRLFRVSFTGELGFEINIPADYGPAVWQALRARGEEFGLAPYGTESMHVLRAEKGYIILGQETDGTVTPDDLGLDWAVGKAKKDFVGKRSLVRPDMVKPDRKQLVGLMTLDPKAVLEEGAQIVEQPNPPVGAKALGHVTSSYWSEVLGHSIALALVSGGRARLGEVLQVPMPDGQIAVRVVEPVFYDREGKRLDG